jgi:hypothetical protein
MFRSKTEIPPARTEEEEVQLAMAISASMAGSNQAHNQASQRRAAAPPKLDRSNPFASLADENSTDASEAGAAAFPGKLQSRTTSAQESTARDVTSADADNATGEHAEGEEKDGKMMAAEAQQIVDPDADEEAHTGEHAEGKEKDEEFNGAEAQPIVDADVDEDAHTGENDDMALEADDALNAIHQLQMLDTTGEMDGPQPSYNVDSGVATKSNGASDSHPEPVAEHPTEEDMHEDEVALPTEAELKAEAEQMVQQARVGFFHGGFG